MKQTDEETGATRNPKVHIYHHHHPGLVRRRPSWWSILRASMCWSRATSLYSPCHVSSANPLQADDAGPECTTMILRGVGSAYMNNWVWWVFKRTSMLGICSYQWMFRIRLKHQLSRTSNTFNVLVATTHHIKIGNMQVLVETQFSAKRDSRLPNAAFKRQHAFKDNGGTSFNFWYAVH